MPQCHGQALQTVTGTPGRYTCPNLEGLSQGGPPEKVMPVRPGG